MRGILIVCCLNKLRCLFDNCGKVRLLYNALKGQLRRSILLLHRLHDLRLNFRLREVGERRNLFGLALVALNHTCGQSAPPAGPADSGRSASALPAPESLTAQTASTVPSK